MAALSHGSRKFYELPNLVVNNSNEGRKCRSKDDLFRYIEESCIGNDSSFSGPFGRRKVVYCDFTASGRSLSFIEEYIREQVLPHYGNTHTTTTVTSLQTTLYRHEARDIVRNAVNASEADAVIFVGSGCTGAIHKLIHALNLLHPPVVFVGPYEHHSNLLPWRELGAEIVWIAQDDRGLVDSNDLKSKLENYTNDGRQLIGCFSAASNVTGILSDTNAITACLHQHGALAFWDYATAGPYAEINMNPVVISEDQASVYKDAVFISPHKFVGGVATPGILLAKKSLFTNPVPSGCGGGSVFFVTEHSHRYLREAEMREEGGTPAIVESIRAGLVFQLKEAVGSEAIMAREHKLCRQAVEAWRSHENLVLLGNTSVPRLPIFSFLIQHKASGLFLHYNFVCALLNDLFGIQARGGCACAGPYAQDLLGMNEILAQKYESFLLEDSRLDRHHLRRYREYSEHEVLRPGFVRLNLPYFVSDDCVQFVLKAVELVAEHGWKLLPQYMFNPETGEWRHRQHQVFRERKWLGSISYSSGHMTYPTPPVSGAAPPTTYKECLMVAEKLFAKAAASKVSVADQRILLGEEADALRWFVLPSEAADLMSGKSVAHLPRNPPFTPRAWTRYENDHPRHEDEELGNTSHDFSLGEDHETDLTHELTVLAETSNRSNNFSGGTECLGVGKQIDLIERNKSIHTAHNTIAQASLLEDFVLSKGSESLPGKQDAIHIVECTDKCDLGNLTGNGNVRTEHSNAPSDRPCEEHHRSISSRSKSKQYANQDLNQLAPGPVQASENLSAVSCSAASTCDGSEGDTADVYSNRKGQEDVTSGTQSCTNCTESRGSRKYENDTELSTLCACNVRHKAQNNATTTARDLNEDGKVSEVQEKTEDAHKSFAIVPQKTQAVQSSCEFVPQKTQVSQSNCAFKGRRDLPKKTEVRNKTGFQSPPKAIFKPTVQAIEEFDMISGGDKILVCLSGGKDSLSLLHTLHQYQYYARPKGVTFALGAVTVDPQSSGYDPRPLIPYLASLGVPYFYEEQGILQQASELPLCESICSFCSRMKRGRLYACARREGYNVLAMGQHLDDLTESFLMSAFHNGLLRTMKANYTVQEGDLRVIRPLVYVREKDLRHFAEKLKNLQVLRTEEQDVVVKAKLPVIPENCPACFGAPKERHRTKQLLAAQELLFPNLYSSLLTAMRPLMARNRVGMESSKMKSGNYEDFL